MCNLSSVHLSTKTKVSPRSFSVCCSALARQKRELELNKLGGNKMKPSNCSEKRDYISGPAKREGRLHPFTSWIPSTRPGEPTASTLLLLSPAHPIPRSLSYHTDLLEWERKSSLQFPALAKPRHPSGRLEGGISAAGAERLRFVACFFPSQGQKFQSWEET